MDSASPRVLVVGQPLIRDFAQFHHSYLEILVRVGVIGTTFPCRSLLGLSSGTPCLKNQLHFHILICLPSGRTGHSLAKKRVDPHRLLSTWVALPGFVWRDCLWLSMDGMCVPSNDNPPTRATDHALACSPATAPPARERSPACARSPWTRCRCEPKTPFGRHPVESFAHRGRPPPLRRLPSGARPVRCSSCSRAWPPAALKTSSLVLRGATSRARRSYGFESSRCAWRRCSTSCSPNACAN
ncbi:LSD1 subclass zinc finger protein [Desulfosoma caldarium]|uniref:LSD1 subclass zinc finger protein n=1 Tax=Desulfosoma caldarium TaxID=610254 RepID=A0A3N1URV1_9BACT|nr:LSD1 subclass zinc finger protein [Desulfosoma caldarium]